MAAYRTTTRRAVVAAIHSISHYVSHNTTNTARNELNSHADTCALGSKFVPLHYTGRVCDVSPYNASYGTERDVPIVTGATVSTDQATGQVYILVINEGIWFGKKLQNSLINPNQLRYAGVSVQDNPLHKSEPLTLSHDDVTIPLSLDGTYMFFPTTTPTQEQLDSSPHIERTFDTEWNPHAVQLAAVQSAEAEDRFGDGFGGVEPGLLQISSVYSLKEMAENMRDHRHISAVDVAERKTFISKERHPAITSENLSERRNIGLHQVKHTLRVTTQRGVRSATLRASRRYRTDRMYQQTKRRNQKFYMDTLFGRCRSISNNTCAQIFANESYFVKAYPMERKSMAGQSLWQFIRDFGVPEQLTSDGASKQTGSKTEFMQNVRKYEIQHHVSEPHRPQQNRAESVIREVKRRWFRQMTKRRVPKQFWDYGIIWVCEVMSLTANLSFALEGRTPVEQLTGKTPDVSEYLDFGFYDWVWYKNNAGVGDNMFGRWLGVSHRVGNLMLYWILTNHGRVISRTTVQRVTNLERSITEVKQRSQEFDERIRELLKDDDHVIQEGNERQLQDWDNLLKIMMKTLRGRNLVRLCQVRRFPKRMKTLHPIP